MKQLTLTSLCALFLFLSLNTHAQETKVKKSKDGKEVKMKGEGGGMALMDADQARQQISANNNLFSQAFIAGDSAAMANIYHSEAKIYAPNMPAINQRSEMGHMVTTIPGMGVKNMTLTSTDVMPAGDMVIETGTYEMGDGTKAMDKGKYMVIWKQEDGKLKIYRDIWNSDMPMSGK